MEGNCNRLCDRLFYICGSLVSVVLISQSLFTGGFLKIVLTNQMMGLILAWSREAEHLICRNLVFHYNLYLSTGQQAPSCTSLPVPAQNPCVGMLMLYFANSQNFLVWLLFCSKYSFHTLLRPINSDPRMPYPD